MEILIYFITYTLILILGIIIGVFIKTKPEPEKIATQAKQIKKSIFKPRIGPIKRPTAVELRKRGTPEEAEEKAMEETLTKIL